MSEERERLLVYTPVWSGEVAGKFHLRYRKPRKVRFKQGPGQAVF